MNKYLSNRLCLFPFLLMLIIVSSAHAVQPVESAHVAEASVVQEQWDPIPEDPKPAHLASNSHYLVSNENHHDQFFPVLSTKKGNAYIGVGTDQNYLLAGWSQPRVMVLMDFDQMVVDLHKVYRVMFLHAKTKEEFISLWNSSKRSKAQVQSLILHEYGITNDQEEKGQVRCEAGCRAVMKAYHVGMIHHMIPRRLAWVQKTYKKRNIDTFLTNQAQYDVIRNLFRAGAVKIIRGDLSKTTLDGVRLALLKKKLVLGTLYLSNAEKYFSYLPHFKSIMQTFPISKESIVLHTWALRNEGNRYAYFVQRAETFINFLNRKEVKTVRDLLRPYIRGIRAGRYGAFPHPVFLLESEAAISSGHQPSAVGKKAPSSI